jgi:purine-binding chemotaxis protein CheW
MDADLQRRQNVSQALIFLLGKGQFGIDILQVQEIRGTDRPTPIPSAPSFFKGVTNLRGQFVPVIDLRVKLGIAVRDESAEGVTIILRVGPQQVGVVVDAVSEVLSVSPEDMKPSPAAEFAPSAVFVRGLITHGDATVVLLDIERLLSSADLKIEDLVACSQAASVLAAGPSAGASSSMMRGGIEKTA